MEKDLRKVNTPYASIEEPDTTLRIALAMVIVTTLSLRKSGKLPVLL
jgi:hypothetical protein